jgi:hypothetical protein
MRTFDEPAGFCPVCNCQLCGHTHNCPGEIRHNPKIELLGAQYIEETHEREPRRRYSTRLDEGFALLVDSGWDGNY